MTTEEPETRAPEEKPAAPAQTAKIGVMVMTPLKHYHGPADLPPQIGRALRELATREDAKGYEFEFLACCGGLCSARNRGVAEFLKSTHAFLLPWDADLHDQHGREADAILRLLSRRQPIVGGLYCKRDRRPRWVANWLSNAKVQDGGMRQVAELGGGFKLYHRKAFEELARIYDATIKYRERETGETMFAFYQIANVDGDLLSEDFFLDYLCRCCKIPIWADTGIRLRQRENVRNEKGELVPVQYPEGAWPPIPAEDAGQ